MLEDRKGEAQQVLDDLYREHLLSFKLIAHKVEIVGVEDYIILFKDSRLYSVDVYWPQGKSFKDAFRSAILAKMERRSGHSAKFH